MLTDKYDKESLISELRNAGARIRGNEVVCPFHDDHNASGGTYRNAEGEWYYKCHSPACGFHGDVYDVRSKRTGTPLPEILKSASNRTDDDFRPQQNDKPQQIYPTYKDLYDSIRLPILAVHKYFSPDTNSLDFVVFRLQNHDGRKTFSQAHLTPEGYVKAAPPKPWPLYGRLSIRESETVIVVEGEKAADALRKIGFTATTSPCGAGKAEHTDWTPLEGKEVFLWPDNDIGGRDHMRGVQSCLERLTDPPTMHWIDPVALELPEKGDAWDLVERTSEDEQKGRIEEILAGSRPLTGSGELSKHFERIRDGQIKEISLPWEYLTQDTRALLPGSITLLCGEPSAGKTWFVLESLMHWYEKGVRCAAFELEDDRTTYLHRILAQRSESDWILDWDRIATTYPIVEDKIKRHAETLDRLAECITTRNGQTVTHEVLTDWLTVQGERGTRVCIIDPVTVTSAAEGDRWVADEAFVERCETLADDFEMSIVLVTHPKKGNRQKFPCVDDLAGGAVYSRVPHTVIWLKIHEDEKPIEIEGCAGLMSHSCNRMAHILKARNGKGTGSRIAYRFNGTTLQFEELGRVNK